MFIDVQCDVHVCVTKVVSTYLLRGTYLPTYLGTYCAAFLSLHCCCAALLRQKFRYQAKAPHIYHTHIRAAAEYTAAATK